MIAQLFSSMSVVYQRYFNDMSGVCQWKSLVQTRNMAASMLPFCCLVSHHSRCYIVFSNLGRIINSDLTNLLHYIVWVFKLKIPWIEISFDKMWCYQKNQILMPSNFLWKEVYPRVLFKCLYNYLINSTFLCLRLQTNQLAVRMDWISFLVNFVNPLSRIS